MKSPQSLRVLFDQAFKISLLLVFAFISVANGEDGEHVTSFENLKVGAFDTLKTDVGSWVSSDGNSIIDNKHAKSGSQCLQLRGGKKTSVTLQVAQTIKTGTVLSFWAERWTKRDPFSFRVEQKSAGEWTEIFNGDRTVRVGRSFLSHVEVPLIDPRITELRFTVTSPMNTGVLIDDLRIAPAKPQKIEAVEVVPLTLPALVGTDSSPLLRLDIQTTGQLAPISVSELLVSLDVSTNPFDIEALKIYLGDASKKFSAAKLVAEQQVLPESDQAFTLSCAENSCELSEGHNTIWIAGRVSSDTDIDNRVGVTLQRVTLSNGKTVSFKSASSSQRIGIAVRQRGDDGVHTFRIPGLATTNKGTLIGVYDVRHRSGGDLPGDIDVGMSRSTDGGRTWEPMRVIMDMGDDPQWRYDGVGDPAILVDQNRGTIWVAGTWSHGNRSWVGSGPGVEPEQTGQLMLVRSDDDGLTWSAPINITKQVKKSEWCFLLQGPGKGITMRDGTLVFAAQYQDPIDKQRLPHSTILYSKDHGESWQIGTGAYDDTTEAQVVEIEEGVLMLNCRYNRKAARVVMTTRDMGKTWLKHPSSEKSLIEPGSCMASLIDADRELGKASYGWLLFSNPNSTQGRHHITIKASSDRGQTWSNQHQLLLDEGSGYGYSCLSMIDEQTIGILYEGSQAQMIFQRIPIEDLIGSKPSE